jgi:hypothetical protein
MHGDLTSLEKYYAIAPEGDVPNEELIDYHMDESLALGRSDSAVRRIQFDADDMPPLVEKILAFDCQALIFPAAENWINKFFTFGTPPGPVAICTKGTACNAFTTLRMRVGSCTDGTGGLASWSHSWRHQESSWSTVNSPFAMGPNTFVIVNWGASIFPARILKISARPFPSLSVTSHAGENVL